MKWPSKNKGPWVEVTPGDQGTPYDEFVSFTYWEPSDSLRSQLLKNARQAGALGFPDVTAPEPLDEPDGLTALRAIVVDACQGRKAAAVELFAKDRERISDIVARLAVGPPTAATTDANRARDKTAHAELVPHLEVLEARVERLEDALHARLGRLQAHFERLSSEFVHELKLAHPYADTLSTRWNPTPLELPDEVRLFGQDTARLLIKELASMSSPPSDQAAEG